MGVAIADLFEESPSSESFILREGHRPVLGPDELRSREGITLESLCPAGRNRLLQGTLHIIEVGGESDGLIEHRSEEHTSELQSLMRISYAVFCLKKKTKNKTEKKKQNTRTTI